MVLSSAVEYFVLLTIFLNVLLFCCCKGSEKGPSVLPHNPTRKFQMQHLFKAATIQDENNLEGKRLSVFEFICFMFLFLV